LNVFNSTPLEGAIFDMDGTMFDTERLRFKMLKQASKEISGEELSDKILYDSLGVSAVTAEKLAQESYGSDYPYKRIRVRADELERQYIREKGVPIKEGLYNLLERLKKNGVLIALATSSRREIAQEYLIAAKVLRFFDVIVCGDDVQKGKPAPDIFLKAAKELNCEPGKCFIFEDSTNGVLAASAAGGLPIYIKDIKDIAPEVKRLAYKSYDQISDFLDELIQQMPKLPVPSLNEQFPQSVGYVVAGIHGFGAVGGGFLAQVFSHWDGYTRPRQIIGATNNVFMGQFINALRKYQVKYERLAFFQTITHIKIIDMNDEQQIVEMYKKSQIIGVSLPEKAIRSQAKSIAKGLLERYENGGKNLTLLIVMNRVNSAKFVKTQVKKALNSLTTPEKAEKITQLTFFSETVVNRMVSRIPNEVILSNLQNEINQIHKNILNYSHKMKTVLEFSNSQLNGSLVHQKTGEIRVSPSGVVDYLSSVSHFFNELSKFNLTLFSSEPDMPLYAIKGSPVLERLRQVITVEDIKTMQEIKNKLSNGPHAIIAWYSALLGYKTIGQGMGDVRVSNLAEHIIKNEIAPALLIENAASKQYVVSITSSFLTRCRASFKDKCTRVGRDPLRKLKQGERIIGTIKLAQKHGINTSGLEFGVACAIMYSLSPINERDLEAQKIKLLYEKNCLIEDVLTFNGDYNASKYACLDKHKDAELLKRIEENFRKLKTDLAI